MRRRGQLSGALFSLRTILWYPPGNYATKLCVLYEKAPLRYDRPNEGAEP